MLAEALENCNSPSDDCNLSVRFAIWCLAVIIIGIRIDQKNTFQARGLRARAISHPRICHFMLTRRYACRLRDVLVAFCALLLLAPHTGVQAEMQDGHEHAGHAAEKGEAADHAMPAGEQKAGEHVHPKVRADSDDIGVSEKLGATIPLDLTFRDEQGNSVRLGELIDAPTIIAPIYYHCPNVCNFLQAGLARALPKVALTPGEGYQVLSVSFDETETPSLARQSKKNYYAAMQEDFPPHAWRFLTGDKENIKKLTDAIGYRFQRVDQDFLHPVAVAVVSPEGKIVRYLYGTSFLPMNLTLALMEGAEGKVGQTVKTMLDFCFSFDPENKTYVFNILRVSATVVIATAVALLTFLLVTGRKKPRN